MDRNALDNLKKYKGVSHLKRAAMNILVKMATEDEVAELTKAFKHIDTDHSGYISVKELMNVINKQHMNMTEADASKMIKESDYAGSG